MLNAFRSSLCGGSIYRFSKQIKEAWDSINSIETLLGFSGRDKFAREAWEFEKAELFRQNSLYDEAKASYNVISNSPSKLHRCHGALGMAELERSRGNREKAIDLSRTARKDYHRMGCRWGECNAILTLVLSGDISLSEGQITANKTEYNFPGNGLESLLFGHNSEKRQLNLP
ncbi:MAG: hypothetical protein NUV86_09190 [Candidatus Scalindua sp.]|nr:hypothetical protein [Candidatus Scalindua sp.]